MRWIPSFVRRRQALTPMPLTLNRRVYRMLRVPLGSGWELHCGMARNTDRSDRTLLSLASPTPLACASSPHSARIPEEFLQLRPGGRETPARGRFEIWFHRSEGAEISALVQ